MKKIILTLSIAFSMNASAGETFKGTSKVYRLDYDQKVMDVEITGAAAKALFEMVSENPDDIFNFDEGTVRVYRNDVACTIKRKLKSKSYKCTISLEEGKARFPPRG